MLTSTHPGSRGQKGTGSRIRIRNTEGKSQQQAHDCRRIILLGTSRHTDFHIVFYIMNFDLMSPEACKLLMPYFLTMSAVLPRDTFQYRSLNLKSPSQERSSSAHARGPIAAHAQSPSAQPLWRDSPDSGRALGIIHSLDGESAHF
jgi:hypothetical protein